MRRFLLVLMLLLGVFPSTAEQLLPGADVRTRVVCGPFGEFIEYQLTATDTGQWRYLAPDLGPYGSVVGNGSVAGNVVTWHGHAVGARLTIISYGNPSCDGLAPELISVPFSLHLPIVRKDGR